MRNITILGATGSIGQSTLDVIRRHPDRFKLFAITANRSVDAMAKLCRDHHPEFAVMNDEASSSQLQELLKDSSVKVLTGSESLSLVTTHQQVDTVVAGIVGAAGLEPTLAAVKSSKRVLLANKEALVMAGHLFMQEVEKNNAELIPLDSEHNAIFQCLPDTRNMQNNQQDCLNNGVRRLILTGSGGPFRTLDMSLLASVTPEQAVAHPNWSMGPKISVDSATMMNKGLELIEARWLFDVDESKIDIVLHRESIIHSLVSYNDGSVLAQMGNPDMRTPIAHALAWPERVESGVEPLNLIEIGQLNFEKADEERFPCLALARQSIQQAGTSGAILNAANEVAVDAFLQQKIKFTDIATLNARALSEIPVRNAESFEMVLEDDHDSRHFVQQEINRLNTVAVSVV